MSYELKGKLYKIYPTEKKSDSFQAREFVVETQETYPQFVKFQLTQDKCALVDNFQTGEEINVHFDLRGREWNEKFFTNLQAWKLDKLTTSANNGPLAADDFPPDGFEIAGDDMDNLPF